MLNLIAGRVAEAYRLTAPVAGEVLEEHLVGDHLAVDRDHEVEPIVSLHGIAHELEEAQRLLAVADQVHGANCHGAIARP